jgi:hypothetical protein
MILEKSVKLVKALLSGGNCYKCQYASLHSNGFKIVGGCLNPTTAYEFPEELVCDHFIKDISKIQE